MTPPGDGTLTLLLCGDVMLGRGIDQVLAHPGDPTLREAYVRDARDYVGLAEAASGPVPWPVDDDWPWGDALADLGSPEAVRILNLETSITRCGDFAPGKAVSYRMNPDNLGCLVTARPDVCVLANNHVLDFGRRGLAETLDVLASAGLASAGAGRHLLQAQAPAVVERDAARVAVIALAHPSSGVPRSWAAGPDRSGVDLLPDLTDATAARVGRRVEAEKRLGSVVVVSVHWGPNWGFDVPRDQVSFAHRLVDAGADVVHGHSSHHPRPLEVHAGRLVIHGCGDFVNDYEGIAGHEGSTAACACSTGSRSPPTAPCAPPTWCRTGRAGSGSSAPAPTTCGGWKRRWTGRAGRSASACVVRPRAGWRWPGTRNP